MKKLYILLLFLVTILIVATGCDSGNESNSPVSPQNPIEELTKISAKTKVELALAKRSTAKYHDIDRAIEDGYIDINVIVQGMGYHYMKVENLDGIFDPSQPEILVYTKNAVNGKMRLVAVEYAVPNTEPMPEGFTGSDDVWVNNSDFGLWLLHAWVWYHNPEGIFNSTNPRISVVESEITYPLP